MDYSKVSWRNMEVRFLPGDFTPNQVKQGIDWADKIIPNSQQDIPSDVYVALVKDDSTQEVAAGVAQPNKEGLFLAKRSFKLKDIQTTIDLVLEDIADFLKNWGRDLGKKRA